MAHRKKLDLVIAIVDGMTFEEKQLLLRLRRPFVAYITDAMGNELFRTLFYHPQVRRPFWWITSSIYVEIDGKEIGVVHRRWHLWRRVYDLYLGIQMRLSFLRRNKQFAVVKNPGLWNWTFTLEDIDGQVLAEIDRDWRGFGFEVFSFQKYHLLILT
ncbi:altered inheritance rate of mitochondria protein 25 isoform X2 [Gossypium australe]|uniref:Phospholipid scramblase n=1 Tax=Gossypium australe TaxID=47621 RepID=A0A5B6UEV1_9ROSI|nr:altered inheritance rate of mitochondria protein 25 isoform X2 [Gossypium australe]